MLAVQCDRTPVDMIMNVLLVRVRTDDKGVLAFQKAGCKLISDFVCVLGCDLARLEGLHAVDLGA